MKKWVAFALVAVAILGTVSFFVLRDKADRAEDNILNMDMLYSGDAVALAGVLYKISARLSAGEVNERYLIGSSLSDELEEWDAERKNALSETGLFSLISRGAKLDRLADRRVALSARIKSFLNDD